MRLDDFDFDLPKSAIALRPACPRDSARLLIADPATAGELAEARVRDLPRLLRAGDVLVFNKTKVLPAVLRGVRERRAMDGREVTVALTLTEPLGDGSWAAFALPARRLRAGDRIRVAPGAAIFVRAKRQDGRVVVAAEGGLGLEEMMAAHGHMPLPPYIWRQRPADEADRADYQTVFAQIPGAVAAPTAGLHFTPQLLANLKAAGIGAAFVTLHVGAGTFLPVKPEAIEGGELHPEWGEIDAATALALEEARARGGRIVAVGTTSLRVLEMAAAGGRLRPWRGATRLFIKPGFAFSVADLLLTNFHLPKSTLFMLVCAFSGTPFMKAAYAQALARGFRFYSYGDACLLYRKNEA